MSHEYYPTLNSNRRLLSRDLHQKFKESVSSNLLVNPWLSSRIQTEVIDFAKRDVEKEYKKSWLSPVIKYKFGASHSPIPIFWSLSSKTVLLIITSDQDRLNTEDSLFYCCTIDVEALSELEEEQGPNLNADKSEPSTISSPECHYKYTHKIRSMMCYFTNKDSIFSNLNY